MAQSIHKKANIPAGSPPLDFELINPVTSGRIMGLLGKVVHVSEIRSLRAIAGLNIITDYAVSTVW